MLNTQGLKFAHPVRPITGKESECLDVTSNNIISIQQYATSVYGHGAVH